MALCLRSKGKLSLFAHKEEYLCQKHMAKMLYITDIPFPYFSGALESKKVKLIALSLYIYIHFKEL